MESFLSLDELCISFSDHDLRTSADSRTQDQHEKDSCYVLKDSKDHRGSLCVRDDFHKQRKGKMKEFHLEADNVVAKNDSRNTYACKLPDIKPTNKSMQMIHVMAGKMGRSRKFYSINADDFTVGAKPGTFSDLRSEEREELNASRRRRNHLPLGESKNYSGGQNWKCNPANDAKSIMADWTRGKEPYSGSAQSGFLAASQRKIFSPRQSVKSGPQLIEVNEEFAETLQMDLPQKVTKFLEMEISLIKGREKTNAMQKRKGSVFSTYRASDTPEGVDPKLIKTRKSWDSAYLDRKERL